MAKEKNTKPPEEGKMTIYDYEQKYTKRQNVRGAKLVLHLIAAAVGILLFFCLFSVTVKVWEFNQYVGIAATVVSVLLYVFLFIVPLIKIVKTESFTVNVNAKTARAAQKHNKRLRREVADKIIDLTAKVEGVGWYDSAVVGALAIAVKAGDEVAIKRTLTNLYTGCIKKSAHDLILKSAEGKLLF